jgi:hypothetical protein
LNNTQIAVIWLDYGDDNQEKDTITAGRKITLLVLTNSQDLYFKKWLCRNLYKIQ